MENRCGFIFLGSHPSVVMACNLKHARSCPRPMCPREANKLPEYQPGICLVSVVRSQLMKRCLEYKDAKALVSGQRSLPQVHTAKTLPRNRRLLQPWPEKQTPSRCYPGWNEFCSAPTYSILYTCGSQKSYLNIYI